MHQLRFWGSEVELDVGHDGLTVCGIASGYEFGEGIIRPVGAQKAPSLFVPPQLAATEALPLRWCICSHAEKPEWDDVDYLKPLRHGAKAVVNLSEIQIVVRMRFVESRFQRLLAALSATAGSTRSYNILLAGSRGEEVANTGADPINSNRPTYFYSETEMIVGQRSLHEGRPEGPPTPRFEY